MQHEKYVARTGSGGTVCFAGSRHNNLDSHVCESLIRSFSNLGFRYLVGCAPGIDRCFRRAFQELVPSNRWTVHCAFPSRAQSFRQIGLSAIYTVGVPSSAASALHRRTTTMVSECTLLVLFPDDPSTGAWGKGSRLAFDTAIQQLKPVFVVTAISPMETERIRVAAASLFSVVSGYWVVPLDVPVKEGAVHA